MAAIAPVLAVLPVAVLALAVLWWPVRLGWKVPFWAFAGGYLAAVVLLFLRPVQQFVLAPLLGARRPSRGGAGVNCGPVLAARAAGQRAAGTP